MLCGSHVTVILVTGLVGRNFNLRSVRIWIKAPEECGRCGFAADVGR